jgi:hypothetical protein
MANEFIARNGLIAQNNSVITGSLIVTNGITGSFTGSLTGSLFGTASYANQALTASYALTYAPVFPFTGSAIITGSLVVTGSILNPTIVTPFIDGVVNSDSAILGNELATNGSGVNWSGSNFATGYTHSTGSISPLTTSISALNNTYYQIAYTITGRTAGFITINFGGISISNVGFTGASGPRTTSTSVFEIVPTTDFNGTVVISLKIINPSAASVSFRTSAGASVLEIRNNNATSNTIIGLNAGTRVTTGGSNTFLGAAAGQNNTTGVANTFIGSSAGTNNTTGTSNTFLGNTAGLSNTAGANNTFLGQNAGRLNTTGASNTFLGANGGVNNTTGTGNVFIGVGTGQTNTTGASNVFIGVSAGLSSTTGASNTFIGTNAGFGNTTGASNIFLGFGAGRFLADGTSANQASSTSVFLGESCRALSASNTNQIVIGSLAIGNGSNTVTIGNTSIVANYFRGSIIINPGNTSGHPSSTDKNLLILNAATTTLLTGALTTQRFTYLPSQTLAFAGASTATNVYGLYVEAPIAGTNATITNNFALGLAGSLKINDTFNIVFDTTNGSKIGTTNLQKISFWNATPIVQPTTAVAAAALVSNAGTALTSTDTFDGYTLQQIVKALRNTGLLA